MFDYSFPYSKPSVRLPSITIDEDTVGSKGNYRKSILFRVDHSMEIYQVYPVDLKIGARMVVAVEIRFDTGIAVHQLKQFHVIEQVMIRF